jgi:hypothetical protein
VALCPSDFKINDNQTACIRPQEKSKLVKNIFQKIGDGILYIISAFIGFLFLIILITRFA